MPKSPPPGHRKMVGLLKKLVRVPKDAKPAKRRKKK